MMQKFSFLLAVLSVFFLGACHAQINKSHEQVMTLDSSMLSFTISFENTSTDSLHSVLIIDTLSDNLDVSTFELCVSSHHYDFFFLDNNIVCWYIYDAKISGVSDKKNNHGFVKYHAKLLDGKHHKEVTNRSAIHYNYDPDFMINTAGIKSLQHHEFNGVELKETNKIHIQTSDNELSLDGYSYFDTEQLYIEIFNEEGLIEFSARVNRDENLKINTSFLLSGQHYLDVYDDHHHEVVKRFSKE